MNDRTYAEAIGVALRARRRLLRLNQTEVAELAGTTQRTVSQVESGKASGLELYAAVAEVLGMVLTILPREQVPPTTPPDGVSPAAPAADETPARDTP